MGKKRKVGEDDNDPPVESGANEHKKTRDAAYNRLSLESLLDKEKEVTRSLTTIQNELIRQRASRTTVYGDNSHRQMNTKRHKLEYALGEIKAEIERRKLRKAGVADHGPIQSGSAAAVAATKWDKPEHTGVKKPESERIREDARDRMREEAQAAAKMEQQKQKQSSGPGPAAAASASTLQEQSAWANAWAATAKAQMPQMPQMPQSSQGMAELSAAYVMGNAFPTPRNNPMGGMGGSMGSGGGMMGSGCGMNGNMMGSGGGGMGGMGGVAPDFDFGAMESQMQANFSQQAAQMGGMGGGCGGCGGMDGMAQMGSMEGMAQMAAQMQAAFNSGANSWRGPAMGGSASGPPAAFARPAPASMPMNSLPAAFRKKT